MTIELALVSYQSHWQYSLTDPLAADSHQDFDKVHELTPNTGFDSSALWSSRRQEREILT